MPICTNCGTELSVDFTDEVECDGHTVILHQEGYCPNCGKHHILSLLSTKRNYSHYHYHLGGNR